MGGALPEDISRICRGKKSLKTAGQGAKAELSNDLTGPQPMSPPLHLPPKDHHTEYLVILGHWDDPQRGKHKAFRHSCCPEPLPVGPERSV